jgi:uncharacterized protein (DUF2384 family)
MRRARANARASTVSGLPQNFSAESERERLSPVAIRAIKGVAAHWALKGAQIAALLGVSASTWDRMSSGSWEGALSQDQLTRISAVVGVFKGLHLLFADDMADRWIQLQNRGPLFDSRTPIEAMIEGGIPMMLDVRRHVDALRGGL